MDATFETTASEIKETDVCPNCDHPLDGKFCGNCGQKRIDHHEFAIRHFFGHLVHEITHLDSNKILKTFFHLVVKPGELAREYLAGRKGKYINPIRMYLTVSALYFLFAWGALSSAGGGGVEATASRPQFVEMARTRGIDPTVLAIKTHEKAGKYSAFFRFASVLVSGLFLTILYYGTGRYYVEHLIFSLYFYSFDFLAKCVVAVFYLTSDYTTLFVYSASRTLYYVVTFIYLFFAQYRVYSESITKTLMKASALFVLEVLLFIFINVAGFMLAVFLS